MRAGIFTDGGKRERERAAEKARRRLEAKAGKAHAPGRPGRPSPKTDPTSRSDIRLRPPTPPEALNRPGASPMRRTIRDGSAWRWPSLALVGDRRPGPAAEDKADEGRRSARRPAYEILGELP